MLKKRKRLTFFRGCGHPPVSEWMNEMAQAEEAFLSSDGAKCGGKKSWACLTWSCRRSSLSYMLRADSNLAAWSTVTGWNQRDFSMDEYFIVSVTQAAAAAAWGPGRFKCVTVNLQIDAGAMQGTHLETHPRNDPYMRDIFHCQIPFFFSTKGCLTECSWSFVKLHLLSNLNKLQSSSYTTILSWLLKPCGTNVFLHHSPCTLHLLLASW